jgi:Uma2 family endonuclease
LSWYKHASERRCQERERLTIAARLPGLEVEVADRPQPVLQCRAALTGTRTGGTVCDMNLVLPTRMTVDEFHRWCQRQEAGRYELEDGRVIQMPSETFGHVKTKDRAKAALAKAIVRSGLPYYAAPDGPTVRIAPDRAYKPDALVAALPEPADDELEIANPVIVVEVLSPSNSRRDLTIKVDGYALVASIQHYLVIDPRDRVVQHFHRQGDTLLPTPDDAVVGTLRLDPPGLEVAVADLLGPKPAA